MALAVTSAGVDLFTGEGTQHVGCLGHRPHRDPQAAPFCWFLLIFFQILSPECSRACPCKFKSQSPHSLAVELWVSYFTSLGFTFLI